MTKGGRNLVILGVLSAVIAFTTTGVSLAIYHNSGDIYLDRSRPGYLPDEGEIEQDGEPEKEYELEKSGVVTTEVLDEYLEALEAEVKALDTYNAPFGAEAVSDEKLGIYVK